MCSRCTLPRDPSLPPAIHLPLSLLILVSPSSAPVSLLVPTHPAHPLGYPFPPRPLPALTSRTDALPSETTAAVERAPLTKIERCEQISPSDKRNFATFPLLSQPFSPASEPHCHPLVSPSPTVSAFVAFQRELFSICAQSETADGGERVSAARGSEREGGEGDLPANRNHPPRATQCRRSLANGSLNGRPVRGSPHHASTRLAPSMIPALQGSKATDPTRRRMPPAAASLATA